MTKEELNKIIESEGDYFEWQNHFKCFIRRNKLKAWCGYVLISKDYPIDSDTTIDIDCHGGVTYHNFDEKGLTIGFDCSHFGDIIPPILPGDLDLFWPDGNAAYRTKEFAVDEVNKMVKQILELKSIKRFIKINALTS